MGTRLIGLVVGMLIAANALGQERVTGGPAKAAFDQTILFPRVLTRPVVTEQAIWVGQGGRVPIWEEPLHAVCRIDPATRQVTATIPLRSQPIALAVGGGAIWVQQQNTTGSLVRIDERTLQPTTVPGVGWCDIFPVLAFGEESVWVVEHDVARAGSVILYQRGTAVVRLDPGTGEVRARIPLPGVATAITVGAGAVWVMREGKVWRIDPATNQIVATIPVPSGADDIAADATGVWVVRNQFAVIGRHGDSELIRIDSATNRIVGAPIRVPCGFGSLAVGQGAIWVTTGRGIGVDSLVQIDPQTGRQVGEPMSIPHVEKVAAGPCGVWVSRWERPKGESHVGLLTPVVP